VFLKVRIVSDVGEGGSVTADLTERERVFREHKPLTRLADMGSRTGCWWLTSVLAVGLRELDSVPMNKRA